LLQVAEEYGQMKYNDFAVVVQPGLKDATSDMLPFDILSTLDCFHPSLKGHQAFAKVIWNNMLTPAAKKATNFDFKSPFICPNNDTLLYTN
jgi:phospholipase B1